MKSGTGRHDAAGKRIRMGWLLACVALALPVLAIRAGSNAVAQTVSYSSVPIQSWRLNGDGHAVLKVGNTLYVGGSFTRATSPSGAQTANRYNLAAFDASSGALISSFVADTDGRVHDLTTDGTSLYVAGSFSNINGVQRRRLAVLDLNTGAVRSGFRADASSTVYSMSLAAGKLYVSGVFTSINGTERSRAAAVSPATGAVDPDFRPAVDGTVLAIAARPDGSKVYIGGPYGRVNGADATNITTLNGATGATAGPELSDVTGYVDDLKVTPDGSRLIAGHSGVPGVGNRTAVYDTASGDRRWRQVVDGDVQGVHLIGDTVWAGFHDGARGDGASRLAGYSLSSGTEDSSFHPTFDRFMGVRDVHGDEVSLVVSGDFSTISGVDVGGFAIFPAGPPTSFVAAHWGYESWRYLDDGTNQGTAWRNPGFNDSSWRSGIGEFGYGNGGERTKLSYGPSWSNKYITTYFRTTFDASAVPSSAAIYMRVDDGAVVYVNGVEAARDNLPAGSVEATTLATDRSGNAEGSSRYFPIDPSLIVPGSNTLAVELHQSSPSSDDAKFFATFVAYGTTSTNLVPTADIVTDRIVGEAPLAVAFDGSGSADADGSVVNWSWNFGDGATASGPTTAHTYAVPGTYNATLAVTDDEGSVGVAGRTITVAPPPPADRVVDVPVTAEWSYLDDGSNLGPDWSGLDVDTSTWAVGVGEFGYGDGDENTVVSYGPSASRKFRTTYFRTLFNATAVPDDLTLTMRIDDGAVVYLNGVEATRFNMPSGEITSSSAAPEAIYGSGETLDRVFTLDPALVRVGANVLAVEVHQNTLGSSDLTFLASLTGTGQGGPPPPPPPPPPANEPPAAELSTDVTTGVAPMAVAFDGSGSSDPDGSVLAWAWDFGDGASASGPTTTHTYTAAGVYAATLTVTDDGGATAIATTSITVTSPPPPPPPPGDGNVVEVPPSATWSYSDLGTDLGSAWRDPDYDASGWAVGVGEFGYGDGDENTVVSYGPSAGSKYRTTYFRTRFEASAVPTELTLSLRVDDGAMVYVNGVEAARFNLPSGAVSYATAAPDAIYGSEEQLDRTFTLDPQLVRVGTNVIAVEVHQNTLGSSDLSFLASLVGTDSADPPPPPPPPSPDGDVASLAATATWSYLDDGSDLGSSWSAFGFDDSAWATGVGEFGYGDGDENTVVSFGPSADRKFRTTYFRSSFNATAVPSAASISLRVDDGAVVYINGVEAARFNLPDGPVSWSTAAPDAIYGSGERTDRVFDIDPQLVRIGTNVIAVEVHQNTLGSSDLSFLASLTGSA